MPARQKKQEKGKKNGEMEEYTPGEEAAEAEEGHGGPGLIEEHEAERRKNDVIMMTSPCIRGERGQALSRNPPRSRTRRGRQWR